MTAARCGFAEAYADNGDKTLAIQNLERSLELNSGNVGGRRSREAVKTAIRSIAQTKGRFAGDKSRFMLIGYRDDASSPYAGNSCQQRTRRWSH